MNNESLLNAADEVAFWRQASRAGILIWDGPKPFAEMHRAFFVEKHPTIPDPKTWKSSYTFPTLATAIAAAQRYLYTKKEPDVYRPT